MANQGIYTNTTWTHGVQFNDTSGNPLALVGTYECDVIRRGDSGTPLFTFNTADGTLDHTLQAVGQLVLTATPAQHQPDVPAGSYRLHLRRVDGGATTWAADGRMVVGQPGDSESYIVFDAATDGSTASSYVVAIGGPVGASNVLSIGTVTTGAPGTDVEVTIGGTSPTQILNFTIPRGEIGEVSQAEFDVVTAALGEATTEGWPFPGLTSDATTNNTTILQSAAPAGGWIIDEIVVESTGGTIEFASVTMSGTTVSAILDRWSVNIPNGTTTINTRDGVALAWSIPEGAYFGWDNGNVRFKNSSNPAGTAAWVSATTLATSLVTSSSIQHEYKVEFTANTGIVGENREAARAADIAERADSNAGRDITGGFPEPFTTDDATVPGSYTVVDENPAPTGGDTVSELRIKCNASATVTIAVVTLSGTTVATIERSVTASVVSGTNTIPLSLRREAGEYLAISGGGYRFETNVNPAKHAVYLSASALAVSLALTSSIQHGFMFAYTAKTGLTETVYRGLENDAAGLHLLDDADNTGATDVVTEFTTAAASHPHPYVPDGTFLLSTVPAKDAGLWGPGKIWAGAIAGATGIPYPIPSSPSLVSMMTGVQNVFAEHAANNDVVALVGDSISHWAYAPTGPEHWFDMFTRFVNYGAALDDPIMTALRPSSTYTPDFYGVTGTGGTTGTKGPLGESLILAAGESRAFTGTYETIGVFYQQALGGGTLTIKRGATTLATINTAGAAEDDKYSGDIATGVTTSASYTIENSVASSELTAIVRLGVKTSGRNRVRTARFAHGSYTFASFGSAARTSMNKIASAWGGEIVPIIALGTNDQFGTVPATIVTNADAMVDVFVAAGSPRQFAIPPVRPSSAWAGSFTGGRTYDGMIGPLRRYYRQNNVQVVPVDTIDLVDAGGTTDGLHGGAAGQWLFLKTFVQNLAGL